MWRQRQKPDFEAPKKQDFIETWKLKNEENNSKYQNGDKKKTDLMHETSPHGKLKECLHTVVAFSKTTK